MAKKDDPKPGGGQSGPAIPLRKQIAMGKQPNTGGSYAKGPRTKP